MSRVLIGEFKEFRHEGEFAFVHVSGMGDVFVHSNTFREVQMNGNEPEFKEYADRQAGLAALHSIRTKTKISLLDIKPTSARPRAKKWGLTPA